MRKREEGSRPARVQRERERGTRGGETRGLKWHSLSVDPRQLSCSLSHDIIMCTCPCITDYLTDRIRIYTRRLCSARCGYSVLAAARVRLPAAYDKINELVSSRHVSRSFSSLSLSLSLFLVSPIASLLLTWPICSPSYMQVQGVIKEVSAHCFFFKCILTLHFSIYRTVFDSFGFLRVSKEIKLK